MNSLAPRRTSNAVAAALPEMSPVLGHAVECLAAPAAGGLVIAPPRWGDPEREEAAKLLPAYEARCEPADRATVNVWVTQLLAARLARPPSSDPEIEAYIDAVMAAAADLPKAAWCTESMRAGLRAWKFWPSPAEIYEVVRLVGARIQAERTALRTIAAGAKAKPSGGTARATPEEVADTLRKYGYPSVRDAPLPARSEDPRRAAQERPRSPEREARDRGTLIAAYEALAAAGGREAAAARIRLGSLRREEAPADRASQPPVPTSVSAT